MRTIYLLFLFLIAALAMGQVVVNPPTPPFTSSQLDAVLGNTRGGIAERGASAWVNLPPGASGLPFVSNGSGADPSYQVLTNAGLANMVAGTLKCEPGSAGAAPPQDCTYSTAGLTNSAKIYGALGNSNGTTGNGHDDTAAITAALTANGTVYFPCGIYRITSTISFSSTTNHYKIFGDGACSQIYLDTGANGTAFAFSSSSCCCVACLTVSDVDFTTPTTGSGSAAFTLTNEQQALFQNNYFNGYQAAVNLNTSYAPRFINNTANALLGGLINIAGVGDETLFNGIFWRNRIGNSGSTISSSVLNLNCNGAFNVSVLGNDIENNYAGVQFQSCNSVDFSDNFIENQTTYNFQLFGTNTAFTIRNNWFGVQAAQTYSNITKALIGGNTVGTTTAFNFGGTALGVIIEPTNVILGAGAFGSLPTPTLSGCGTGPSIVGTRYAGSVQEGTSASGCTVTFELAFDTIAPVCVYQADSAAINPISQTSLSQTSFTISHPTASGDFFSYICQVFKQ